MFGSGDLGMGIRFVIQDMASNVAQKIGSSLKTLQNQVNTTATNIQAAAARMQSGLFGVVMAVTLLIAPFTAAIGAANKFEATMSEVFAKGGARDKAELDRLRQTALSMKNMRLSNAQQRAEGMVEFAKGGFKGIQIDRGLDPAMALSVAGDISMSRSVETVSNIMHQFGKGSQDFGHIADGIVLAANETSQSVEDLSQAMKFAGPNARVLGQSMEQTFASMMLMAQGGLKGTIAARSLYNSLISLADPTKKQANALKSIGLDLYSGPNRSFIGVNNMIDYLKNALGGANGETVSKTLVGIIGKDALKNLNSLLNTQIEIVRDGKTVYLQGGDALRYYTEMQMNASQGMGAAMRTAKEMKDNLQGDIDEIKNTFYNFKITVGEAFQEGLRPFAKAITSLLVTLIEFAKTPFGQTVIRWAGALAAAAAAAIAFGYAFTVILPAMASMVIAGAPWIALIGGIVAFLYKAVNGMKEFGEAALDANRNLEKPLTTWQRIGGFMAGMGEIWSSWNGSTFELSEDLHDKLKASGDLENLLTTGTWMVRAKEFFKGFAAGDTDFSSTTKAFQELGDSLWNLLAVFGLGEKATGDTNSWYNIGKLLKETFGEALRLTLNGIAFAFKTIIESLTLFIALLKEVGRVSAPGGPGFGDFKWSNVTNTLKNGGEIKTDEDAEGQFIDDVSNTSWWGKMTGNKKKIYVPPSKRPGAGNEGEAAYKKTDVNVNVVLQGDAEKLFNALIQKQTLDHYRDDGN